MLIQAAREQRWRPDMQRLEQLTLPNDMTQQDYAEAWAWVHFLLTSTPQRSDLFRSYLARIRMTGAAPPLSQVLSTDDPQSPSMLLQYLQSLPK
jgi:hypothetical protein